jgi:UDP-N-acetylmuramyl pentapeptide phosphotransferase/UDP-N-acetylglucosamine-1-phosphate transferase
MAAYNFWIIFAVTLLASAGLVLTQRWHGRFSFDSTQGVQKQHTEPRPRIGGVAIVCGLVAAWLLAEPLVRDIFDTLLLAGIPAFAFGLLEDISKKVSVLARLLATMFSGVVAWWLTGIAMQDTGVMPLDWLLSVSFVAVLFTAFAVGGVANAINIIDGFNGLASGAVVIMLGAVGLIALRVGDAPLSAVCFMSAATALGFGVINWPMGKLFLGDGGAYLLGFVLAWMAVILPMRHSDINAWATLLVCAYPVLEVAFSVRRRRNRSGQHPGQPDRLHLHHLVHRRIVRQYLPKLSATLQNSLTSPICWLFVAMPAAWAVVFAHNTPMLVLGFASVSFAYAAGYARLTQFRWCFSARTLRPVIASEARQSIPSTKASL